ncbi:MAG: hypothetical protein H6621_12845 [Halobacteriovoraceae bacterium]|nr:hypothetical protein [Halobacteriovoraceae bacterium]
MAEEFAEGFPECTVFRSFEDVKNRELEIFPWIITPEIFNYFIQKQNFEYLEDLIIVVDEFHLFSIWGESFRESLLEFIENSFSLQASMLFLTATFDETLLEKMKHCFELNFDNSFLVDIGNQHLLYKPQSYFEWNWLSKRGYKNVLPLLIRLALKKGRVLLFVKYRRDVDSWRKWALKNKIQVLGCRGGESMDFSQNLKKKIPDLIVATTVLSHGVNLPSIHFIFFTYKEAHSDIFLQMVARGGRKKESYWVHTPEKCPFRGKCASLSAKILLLVRAWFYAITRNPFK